MTRTNQSRPTQPRAAATSTTPHPLPPHAAECTPPLSTDALVIEPARSSIACSTRRRRGHVRATQTPHASSPSRSHAEAQDPARPAMNSRCKAQGWQSPGFASSQTAPKHESASPPRTTPPPPHAATSTSPPAPRTPPRAAPASTRPPAACAAPVTTPAARHARSQQAGFDNRHQRARDDAAPASRAHPRAATTRTCARCSGTSRSKPACRTLCVRYLSGNPNAQKTKARA